MSKRVESAADAPILLTMGEAAGIGPEIAIQAWKALGGRIGARALRIVGDPSLFPDIPDVIATGAKTSRVPGKPDPGNNAATIEAIEIAVREAMAGRAAAVVTAPINKAVLMRSGFGFPGHTEFLGALTGTPHPVMMLASDMLRVVPLTIHMPLLDVPRAVTTEAIVAQGTIILEALKRDFAIARPRLAVAGLNPHPGEFGDEDLRIVAPAVEALTLRGHDVRGPLPADTLFHEEARKTYDAALCMYHDQALIPIKTLSFWDGVNVTLGLPIVRTSPDHGTAFDIAGTGKADARSMIAAIRMAAEIADARRG
jgi:4-hydroxythreonine-4-phosphate dehydrogenase